MPRDLSNDAVSFYNGTNYEITNNGLIREIPTTSTTTTTTTTAPERDRGGWASITRRQGYVGDYISEYLTNVDSNMAPTEPVFSCDICNQVGKIGEIFRIDRYMVCTKCSESRARICEGCGEKHLRFCDERPNNRGGVSRFCRDCDTRSCDSCGIVRDLVQNMDHIGSSPRCNACIKNFRTELLRVGTGKPTELFPHSRLIGVEIESVNGDMSLLQRYNEDLQSRLHHDGSLVGDSAVEVVTDPLSGDKFERNVRLVTGAMKMADWEVNKSCGLHLHLDAYDISKSPKLMTRVMHVYKVIEPFLYSLITPDRAENNYCVSLRKLDYREIVRRLANNEEIDQSLVDGSLYEGWDTDQELLLRKMDKYADSTGSINLHYFGVNLHSIGYRKTIEIRYHHGTIDPFVILNWASLHEHILEYCVGDYKYENVQALHKKAIKPKQIVELFSLPDSVKDYLIAQRKKYHLKKKVATISVSVPIYTEVA